MSNNSRFSDQRFLPHAIQAFFWGRAREHPSDAADSHQGQLRSYIPEIHTHKCPNPPGNNTEAVHLNPPQAAPPPTHAPVHDDSDARSDSSMPDLLSDGWSDSDSSQDARDVEMDIVPDDDDDNWVDEDQDMAPFPSTVPVDQATTTDRRARVEEDVEPQPPQPNRTPNPAPPPPSHTGAGASLPFSPLDPWNFDPGTTRPPGRLFPLFPNPAGSSGNGNNRAPNRDDTPTNPHTQPTQPPQPDRNSLPGNAQQDTRGPRFHAHTFVLGMDGAGRAIPIPPDAFSAMFNQFGLAMPQQQARTPQPGQPPAQPGENRDQPRQPGDPGQLPPFADFVVGGIGTFPPLFANTFGPRQQGPADDPGNGDGPEAGRGAPAWAELLRTMLGGEPPEDREDPERAKKLVEGLERVPVGLVKRMTRVDGIPGGHEDLAEPESGKVPGCAICWDSLLPEETSGDAGPHSNSITTPTSEHPAEGSDSRPSVSDPTPDDDTSTAIICLPCSHVFHASCLIPWFSKPKHTTCPTCRFDVDPKNLTYTPPRRSRPTPTTTATNAAPPNDTQPPPVPNSTTTANPSAVPPSTTHRAQDHDHPPLEPISDDEDDDEHDHPDFVVEPPVFIPDFFAAQPQRTFFDMFRGLATPQAQDPNNDDREQQGHGPLPNETPNDRHDIPLQTFGFEFGPQQPPVFGPPPPPEHQTHGMGATTADATHDHGHEPHPGPFPDFGRGGVGHAHFHAPGIAVDFTLHVPPEQGMDPERISRAVQDQAAAFLRFFAGGGGGPGTGQPAGSTPTPGAGGMNHEPEVAREWMPPPAPGPTLRQRVEAKERQAGLRCNDPSCGIGPSDEDPIPEVFNDLSSPSIKRAGILKDGGEEAVCGHVFHPSCLVSADRCAGWGERDRPTNDGGEEYEVVSCPVCRSVGKVPREVWEEGARALLF